MEKRHAIVESATPLHETEQVTVTADLQLRHGSDITTEFRTNPDLLGGIRIKLGSTVWDGSVKSRLEALRDKVLA
jgi:F-type H+-transporting ATPase subunit delta